MSDNINNDNGLIDKVTLWRLKAVRKYIMKVAIWLVVAGVVLGALMILLVEGAQRWQVTGKFMGMMMILALMIVISFNNFKMLETQKTSVQVFAILGLVSNLIWAFLWIVLDWNPELGNSECLERVCGASTILKTAGIASYMSVLGLVGSNVLALYEGDKAGIIKPLKITVVICAFYVTFYLSIMLLLSYRFETDFSERLGMLAGFLGFVCVIVMIITVIFSSSEKGRKRAADMEKTQNVVMGEDATQGLKENKKTDEELRAEIEEKVRREMIEKEVRAKLEAEMKNDQKE